MNWGVAAIGKTRAVRKEIAKQFANVKCVEPEEMLRQQAASLIDQCLAVQDPTGAVKVIAGGSQGSGRKPGSIRNSLTITIEPQWGFVEDEIEDKEPAENTEGTGQLASQAA